MPYVTGGPPMEGMPARPAARRATGRVMRRVRGGVQLGGMYDVLPGVTGVPVPVEPANPGAGPNAGWTTIDHTPTGTPLFVPAAYGVTGAVPITGPRAAISPSDLRQYYGVNPDGSFAAGGTQGGITVYDNNPQSATFYPDRSIQGQSVAYWLMQGQTVAQAQANAQLWAQAVGVPIQTVASLGPIGPGDPLYNILQNQGALALATLAPQPSAPASAVTVAPPVPASPVAQSVAATTAPSVLVSPPLAPSPADLPVPDATADDSTQLLPAQPAVDLTATMPAAMPAPLPVQTSSVWGNISALIEAHPIATTLIIAAAGWGASRGLSHRGQR